MVNFAVALTSMTVIGGAVIMFAMWAYEEYRRNQRRQTYESESSARDRVHKAPPQPANDCSICRDVLRAPLEILPCGHLFHKTCIGRWSQQRMVCPICRASIPDEYRQRFR